MSFTKLLCCNTWVSVENATWIFRQAQTCNIWWLYISKYTYSKYIYKVRCKVKSSIFHVYRICNIYKCLLLSCSRDLCLSQKHRSPKFKSSKSQIDASDESWKAIIWKGPGFLFNLTCLFFNLRGSVFISKQTPRQHFLQNIWSVNWPNIYTPENYFAGIQLWVVYFFAYFSYWLFSVFSYIALVEAVRFAWSLYLNWWGDIEVHNDVKCILLSCGRICMAQVVCKAIHWSILLENVCSQCLASRICFRNSLTSLCFQCLKCWQGHVYIGGINWFSFCIGIAG